MKKTTLFALLVFSLLGTHAQRTTDVLTYNYLITLSDVSDTISCVAEIHFIHLKDQTGAGFDLAAVKNGKGMLVTGVLDGTGEKIGFRQTADNRLLLQFPDKKRAGDSARVIITYVGIPADGMIISKNKFGKRTFFADNWPDRAHQWLVCNDEPGDKALVSFRVMAPTHYTVVSNGLLTGITAPDSLTKISTWTSAVPLPPKVMVIGAADFAVDTAGYLNDVAVTSWVFSENKEKGFRDYSIAPQILFFYDAWIGPYPFEKLANVQSKTIYGGMENAGAIFYFENSVTGEENIEGLIAHEIVHQWFGDMASEKSFAHLWLSEGFATYLTHVYMESRYGTDSLNNRMRADRETVQEWVNANKRPVVDSTKNYMRLLNANSYQKGGWILHMLRRELGDSIFHTAVRSYYARYAGRNADSDDFRAVVEEISGKQLGYFFNQWLHRNYNPELQIQLTGNLLQVRQTHQGLPFRFPLKLNFIYEQETITRIVDISQVEHSFNLGNFRKPLRIEADPDASVLAGIAIQQMH